jgi:hypothetical protein
MPVVVRGTSSVWATWASSMTSLRVPWEEASLIDEDHGAAALEAALPTPATHVDALAGVHIQGGEDGIDLTGGSGMRVKVMKAAAS